MKILNTALCAAVLSVGVSAGAAMAASWHDPYTSLVSFGDSLTDDGKSGMLAPPSFGGRFTNGLTYAELLAADVNAAGKFSTNLALGGATAGPVNTNAYPDPAAADPFDTFDSQVGTLAFLSGGLPLGANPLFTVLFGANDIFQGGGGFDAANAVAANILAVNALNPSFDDFLLFNLPDASLTPAFAGTALAPVVQAQVQAFNDRLEDQADLLRGAGLNIIEFDLFTSNAALLQNPGAIGITNITDPCAADLFTFDPANNCAFDPLTMSVDLALADAFLFVDGVHPNRVAHAQIASQVRFSLIPLPGALPLLLAGLAGFAVLRRRAVSA